MTPQQNYKALVEMLFFHTPSKAVMLLRETGWLEQWIPEFNRLFGVPQSAQYHPEVDTGIHALMVLDVAEGLAAPEDVRVACFVHDFGKGTTPADVLPRHIGHEERSVKLLSEFAKRFAIPKETYELCELVAAEHGNIHRSTDLNASALVRLFERCDAFNHPVRFVKALEACEYDARGRLGHEYALYPQRDRLSSCLHVARSANVDITRAFMTERGHDEQTIQRAITKERVEALQKFLKEKDE